MGFPARRGCRCVAIGLVWVEGIPSGSDNATLVARRRPRSGGRPCSVRSRAGFRGSHLLERRESHLQGPFGEVPDADREPGLVGFLMQRAHMGDLVFDMAQLPPGSFALTGESNKGLTRKPPTIAMIAAADPATVEGNACQRILEAQSVEPRRVITPRTICRA